MSNEKLKSKLRERFKDAEYAHSYMETFINAAIATQIKVLREQRGLTQGELAELTSMKQERISVLENVDYGTWNVKTLRRLAEAFDVVLKVSFETFSQAIEGVDSFSREALQRTTRVEDLIASVVNAPTAINFPDEPKSANASRFASHGKDNFQQSALRDEVWLFDRPRSDDRPKLEPFSIPQYSRKLSPTSAAMAMT